MTMREPPPPFAFNVHTNEPVKWYEANRYVFGGPGNDESNVLNSGQDPEIGVKDGKGEGQLRMDVKKENLLHYWQVEMAKEKEERHHWEWERLRRDHEMRVL
jgi:hypothetical protein